MNSLHPDSPKEREEASLWAAKLDGSALEASDRTALDSWLAASPRHRALLSEYCQFSADLEQELPLLVASGRISVPSETPRTRRSPARILWFAGSLAAAAAVAVGVWLVRPARETRAVATAVAQRQTLRLADGSVVELNARTNLLVNLSGQERHVRMADGEAFFTVAKDKARPFIVETPAGSVRVTGTIFDVHADSSADLAVTVVEGSVQVNPGRARDGSTPAPVPLTAGDRLVLIDGLVQRDRLEAQDLDDALAWRRGQAVFRGAPLSAALAQFQRYHGRTITVEPAIASLAVGGRFDLDDLNGFLNALEAFLPVQVSPQSSGAIAVTARPGS